MRKFWILIGLLTAVFSGAEEEVMVRATGDRVSLRAAPELSGVLMDRAALDEEFILADNTNREWVGVVPPERIDLWVHSDFLEGDTVIPARLNIRSGPSLNHTVVGVVRGGTQLTVRGEVGGWIKIAPLPETTVWISRKYCAADSGQPVVPQPEAEPKPDVRAVIQVIPAEEPKAAEEVREPIVITGTEFQPEINEVLTSATASLNESRSLVPDQRKTQGAEWSFTGLLKPEEGVLSKLVDMDTGQVLICYIRGNAVQMKECEGKRVSIFGRTYWAQDLERPMVVPVTLQVLED